MPSVGSLLLQKVIVEWEDKSISPIVYTAWLSEVQSQAFITFPENSPDLPPQRERKARQLQTSTESNGMLTGHKQSQVWTAALKRHLTCHQFKSLSLSADAEFANTYSKDDWYTKEGLQTSLQLDGYFQIPLISCLDEEFSITSNLLPDKCWLTLSIHSPTDYVEKVLSCCTYTWARLLAPPSLSTLWRLRAPALTANTLIPLPGTARAGVNSSWNLTLVRLWTKTQVTPPN